MRSTRSMVKKLLLVILITCGLVTNGLAFDLTQHHSEEIPKASDVFSNTWVTEAEKQFAAKHPNGARDITIAAGAIWILFIIYGIWCTGRTAGSHPFPRGRIQNGSAHNRFKLSLISRWGGALAIPMMVLRQIPPPVLSTCRRPSPVA